MIFRLARNTGKALAVAGTVGMLAACSAGSQTPDAVGQAVGDVRPVGEASGMDLVTTIDESGRVLHLSPGGRRLSFPPTPCPGQDAADPQFADQTITWTRLDGGTSLPISTTDGPEGFAGDWVGAGFTQTARGAALAGIHLIESASRGATQAFRMLQFTVAAPVHDNTYIDEAARQELINRTMMVAHPAVPADSPESAPAPRWASSLGNIAAYKVSTTPQPDPRDAVVDYAVPAGEAFTTHRYILHWSSGEWNLEVGADGPTTSTATTTDLSGWTRFPDSGTTVLTCNKAS